MVLLMPFYVGQAGDETETDRKPSMCAETREGMGSKKKARLFEATSEAIVCIYQFTTGVGRSRR